MTKKIIAVDMDDVLADESAGLRQFINDNYDTNHTAEDYLQDHTEYWGYWEFVWQVDHLEAENRFESYITSEAKLGLRIIEGAQEAISLLKKDFDLIIVTSRENHLVQKTHQWLDEHFKNTFSGVEFVSLWEEDKKKVTKGMICKSIGADYLIDDHADHCLLALEEGIKPLLFGDYGWNRKREVPNGITRVANWDEVVDYFYGKNRK